MSLFSRDPHVTDATLLLLMQGELRARTLRHVQRHLAACSDCRMRQFHLMETDEQLRRDGQPIVTRSATAGHERLAAMLAQQARVTELGWLARLRRSPLLRPAVLLRVAAVVSLLALAVAWRQLDLPLQDRIAVYEDTGPEPNHVLTPGSANTVALNELCGLSDSELDPRVSPEKERAVFRAYGLNERAAKAYQVDYLINPQLGGNDRIENLWPEPYGATVWNAHAKDALEARLHGMVCSGQVDLQAAQQDLSTDWIAAYKKYFGTQRPVSTVAELDRPSLVEDPLR